MFEDGDDVQDDDDVDDDESGDDGETLVTWTPPYDGNSDDVDNDANGDDIEDNDDENVLVRPWWPELSPIYLSPPR